VFPFLKETGEDKFFYDALAGKTAIARDRPYRIPETGRVGFFEGYYSPIRDEEGEVVGGLAIIRDMAERKRAEKALRESETRFRAVFEGAGIGIALLDLQGQVMSNNPALQKMLGYSSQTLSKMSFRDFTHPDDLARNETLFQKLVAGEMDSYRMEKRYLCRDGRIMWGNLTVSLVRDMEGNPQFTIGMVKDITDRKQMEAELAEVQHRLIGSREAERLHLAQELHDGPLQDLNSITYQLSELWEAHLAEEQRSTLITSQVTLQRVIKFLRLLCGELRPPTLAPFGLEKAIRSHAEQFQKNHPGWKVELDLMADGQTLAEQVRFTLFRIYQQSLNNAAKHAEGDQLSVRFKFDESQVILEIKDNGRGFEVPYRQVELARGGHLGLVGATERAEAIGGHLEIESVLGVGTVIRAIVPRNNEVSSKVLSGE
jgi:PAS domain S-box-containing protein